MCLLGGVSVCLPSRVSLHACAHVALRPWVASSMPLGRRDTQLRGGMGRQACDLLLAMSMVAHVLTVLCAR